jgi:hypothetical protein
MSNHRARTWDHRESKFLGPKLLPSGHNLIIDSSSSSSNSNENINIIEIVAHIRNIFQYSLILTVEILELQVLSFILLENIPLALENLDNVNYQLTSLLITGLIESLNNWFFFTQKNKYIKYKYKYKYKCSASQIN